MNPAKPWSAVAFNTAPDSSNRIHSDEVARQYGFKGGLVPGVTVTAYLAHPAVEAWGLDFLTQGEIHARVGKPLYDDYGFRVEVEDADGAYRAALVDQEGTQCAEAWVRLATEPMTPPVLRGDPLLRRDLQVPLATRETMERLKVEGMHALASRWGGPDTRSASYLREPQQMPWLLQAGGGGYANLSYMLGLTNWVLAGNAVMNPWIHLQTDSRNHAPVPAGSDLIAECAIAELFERKGHEFVDLDVNVFFRDTGRIAMTARLRAIYRMRGAA